MLKKLPHVWGLEILIVAVACAVAKDASQISGISLLLFVIVAVAAVLVMLFKRFGSVGK